MEKKYNTTPRLQGFESIVLGDQKICQSILQDMGKSAYVSYDLFQKPNLYQAFFNSIAKHVTGAILKKRQLTTPYEPFDFEKNLEVSTFPYIGYPDIQEGKLREPKNYRNQRKLEKKYRYYSDYLKLRSKFTSSKKKNIGFSYFWSPHAKSMLKQHNVFGVPEDLIYVPDSNDQVRYILDNVGNVLDAHLEQPSNQSLIRMILESLENFLFSQISSFPLDLPRLDLYVVATKASLWNSLISHQLQSRGTKIIQVQEGFGTDVIFDEPFYGFCEHSGTDFYIGPGSTKLLENDQKPNYFSFQNNAEFINTLSLDDNQLHQGDHDLFLVPSLKIEERKTKIMYVPDSLLLSGRYGPYATINETLYVEWQHLLLESYREHIFYWKHHIKGHSYFRKNGVPDFLEDYKNVKLITEKFESVYQEADLFVFDQITSAFQIALSSNKPIIYFDIGKRNLTKIGLEKIKNRCIYFKPKFFNVDEIRSALPKKIDEIENIFLKEKLVTNNLLEPISKKAFTDVIQMALS